MRSSAYDNPHRRTQVTHDLVGVTAMPVVVTNSAYDKAGRRTTLSAQIGSVDDFVTAYGYDNLHRMTGIQQQGVTGGNAVADKRIDLTYDAASQWQSIKRYEDLSTGVIKGSGAYTGQFRGDVIPHLIQYMLLAPLFGPRPDQAEVVFWLDEYLEDGQIIGTIVANDPDGDQLTYSANIDLDAFGLALVPVTLADGSSAVHLVFVDWLPVYLELIDDPYWSFQVEASDGALTAQQTIRFDFNQSAFLGTDKKEGGAAPAWNEIAGYPQNLPPAGEVTVMVAIRGTHSFIILLDSTGASTAYSGSPGNGKLVADKGPYGVYEGYTAKVKYQILGNFNADYVIAKMDQTVADINDAKRTYYVKTNNCYCVVTALLKKANVPLPTSADPEGKIKEGTLGWGKMPDGLGPGGE